MSDPNKLAKAFSDLEGDICDINCMSVLTLETVNDTFGQVGKIPDPDYANAAIFAVRHLLQMVDALKAKYYKALAPIDASWRYGPSGQPGGPARYPTIV
jgi:hypothetical protein